MADILREASGPASVIVTVTKCLAETARGRKDFAQGSRSFFLSCRDKHDGEEQFTSQKLAKRDPDRGQDNTGSLETHVQ